MHSRARCHILPRVNTGSGVPFDLSAANVPLEEDIRDIPVGDATEVDVLVRGLVEDDSVTAMEFVAKVNVEDSDEAVTTIIKSITTTESASGVIESTLDDLVKKGRFFLTAINGIYLERNTYTYAVTATVTRDGDPFTRVVQKGTISALQGASDLDSPLADGSFTADGTVYASGLPTD